MKLKIYFLVLPLVLVMAACNSQPPIPPTQELPAATMDTTKVEETVAPTKVTSDQSQSEISFSRDVLPIFLQMAASCHGNSGGLSLETYEGTMMVVVPGDPEGSVLYQRLLGQGGPVMPPSGPLPDSQIQLIYDWIKQGAKNN